jgi:hypothetical protein
MVLVVYYQRYNKMKLLFVVLLLAVCTVSQPCYTLC